MNGLRITGLGAVGGFGSGREAFAAALAGPPVPPGTWTFAQPHQDLPAFRADAAALDAFIPRRALRRADAFSRFALLGVCLALADAGLPQQDLGEDTALVLASGGGATGSTAALLDAVIADGDLCASPTHFAHSLHNSAAANLSILLGIRGPNLSVTQGFASVPSGLLAARSLLASGRARRVLFCAVEEVSDLTLLLAQAEEPGCVPGEGAVGFVLEAGEGPALARLASIRFPADPAWMDSTPTLPGLMDRWGAGPLSPAFDLAAAVLALRGAKVAGFPGPAPERLRCFWNLPGEGSAACLLV